MKCSDWVNAIPQLEERSHLIDEEIEMECQMTLSTICLVFPYI